MKTLLTTIIITFFSISSAFAHYLWIETNAAGKLNNPQTVNVFYGEYTYGVIENTKGEAFNKVNHFSLWLIAPNGKKEALEVTQKENHYTTNFTPNQKGTYTIVLNNNDIEVLDFTQYDFGIFKTHYHSTATVQVGNTQTTESSVDNPDGIVLKKLTTENNSTTFQVFYKNKPLPNQEIDAYVADHWTKKLTTDKDGKISLSLPWDTKYILETTIKEEVPGKFNGKEYEFIWHCATFCIK